VPDDTGNRPVFAPETREQSVPKRAKGDKRALSSMGFFAERSLHTGEIASVLDQDIRPYLCRPSKEYDSGRTRIFRASCGAGGLHVTPVLF
jgi:hypothetical protein